MAARGAVLALTLPTEYFPDGDESCRTAGMHLAQELGSYLEGRGHMIPTWVKGGVPEDAWMHLESECRGARYRFAIVFFPRGADTCSMAIQGEVELAASEAAAQDEIVRELLRGFGAGYRNRELLSQAEFNARY